MAKAQVGKDRWNKTFARGLAATTEQLKRISQLRAAIKDLVPDDNNGKGIRFLLQIGAYIDSVAEETTEMQQVLLELWNIASGGTRGMEDVDEQ